jgi:phage-related protein
MDAGGHSRLRLQMCPNFKTIGEEVSELTYYEQSHIYVFIYMYYKHSYIMHMLQMD